MDFWECIISLNSLLIGVSPHVFWLVVVRDNWSPRMPHLFFPMRNRLVSKLTLERFWVFWRWNLVLILLELTMAAEKYRKSMFGIQFLARWTPMNNNFLVEERWEIDCCCRKCQRCWMMSACGWRRLKWRWFFFGYRWLPLNLVLRLLYL